MKVTIIGAGIIGLTTAYYLLDRGVEVEIIEKGSGEEGCSYGNAGYICPSHFMPLPSPGIVTAGLKYMMDNTSPFYIKPRLDLDLLKWGYHFVKSATQKVADKNSMALHHLSQYSHKEILKLSLETNSAFDLREDGCLMMYSKEETGHHEIEMAHHANELGIKTTILDQKQLKDAEPLISDHLLGAVLYHQDCHINPMKYMAFMRSHLSNKGVTFHYNTTVEGFKKIGKNISTIMTNRGDKSVDKVLVATGAWLQSLTRDLNENLLLQAGKGYSVTYQNTDSNLKRPAILLDDRVAMTPFGNHFRVGGTMEISGINDKIHMNRVKGIVAAVNKNIKIPGVTLPTQDKVWYGLRPCSPDGLPYLGRSSKTDNLFAAGGHAMLGISLSAGSGSLLSKIIMGEQSPIDLSPFRLDRF
jgi:D-amino-acid dehydrogenase